MPVQRLRAEAVRDSLLAVSGQLNSADVRAIQALPILEEEAARPT